MDSVCWQRPPANLVLTDTEIHVWRASLDQPASYVRRLTLTLSPDEEEKAERFYFVQDRQHFIVGRGLLRMILGQYLGLEPDRLRFRYSGRGKPSLEPRHLPTGTTGETAVLQGRLSRAIRFNLSHSQGLVLYAVTHTRKVGVDMEHVRPIAEVDLIVEQFFSAREQAAFRALSDEQRWEAFFNCWTRKEAYIKATGSGLAHPLDQIEVSLTPGEPARLLQVTGAPKEASRWSMQALKPAPGHVAALAAEGDDWRLRYWEPDTPSRIHRATGVAHGTEQIDLPHKVGKGEKYVQQDSGACF